MSVTSYLFYLLMKLHILKLLQHSLVVAFFCTVPEIRLMASDIIQTNSSDLIALVGGIPVYSHELTTDSSHAKQIDPSKYGMEPSVKEASQLKQSLRERSFMNKVRSIIYQKLEAEWGVEVSESEINSKWRELTKNVDFNSAAKNQHDFYLPLFEAVMEVRQSNALADIVYTNKLQNKMSKSEWDAQLNYFSTPKRINLLSNLVNQTAQDIKKPDASIKLMLLDQKVNEKIDAEISKEDSEYAKQKMLLEKDPANRKILNYLALKKDAWWKREYRMLNVELHDNELSNFWNKVCS